MVRKRMATSTLTSKGQTTIPREVRDALGLRAGMQIVFEIQEGSAVLRPHPGASSLFGALAGSDDQAIDFPAARAAAQEQWAAEAGEEGK